jgi:hypothetical protein
LYDPALSQPQIQMLFTADGNNDPSWFSRFENDDYFIGFCSSKKRGSTKSSRLPSGASKMGGPFLATILNPIAKLLSKYQVDTCG